MKREKVKMTKSLIFPALKGEIIIKEGIMKKLIQNCLNGSS